MGSSVQAYRALRRVECTSVLTECFKNQSPRESPSMTPKDEAYER